MEDFLNQIAQVEDESFSSFVARFKKFKALKKPKPNSKSVLIRDVTAFIGADLAAAFEGLVDETKLEDILVAREAAGRPVSLDALVAAADGEESELNTSQQQLEVEKEEPMAEDTAAAPTTTAAEPEVQQEQQQEQKQPEEEAMAPAPETEAEAPVPEQTEQTEQVEQPQQVEEQPAATVTESAMDTTAQPTTETETTEEQKPEEAMETKQEGEGQMEAKQEQQEGESSSPDSSLAATGASLLAGAPILNKSASGPRSSTSGRPEKYGVFVGGCHTTSSDEEIRSYVVEKIGETFMTLDIKKALPPSTENRGYFFVEFDNFEAADHARKTLNGADFRGRTLNASWTNKRENAPRLEDIASAPVVQKTVYVHHLPKDTTEELLREQLAQFGEMKTVNIIRTPTGEPKGFCFVEFVEGSAAEAALKSIKEGAIKVHNQVLFAEFARPLERGDRRQSHPSGSPGYRGRDQYGGPGPMYDYGRDRGYPPQERYSPYGRPPYNAPPPAGRGSPSGYSAPPSPYGARPGGPAPYGAPRDPYSAPAYGGAPSPYGQPSYGAPGTYPPSSYGQYPGYPQQPGASGRPASGAPGQPAAPGYGYPSQYSQYPGYGGYPAGSTTGATSGASTTPSTTSAAAPQTAPAATATSTAGGMTPQQQQQYQQYYQQYYAQYAQQQQQQGAAAGSTPAASATSAPSTAYPGFSQQQAAYYAAYAKK